MLTQNTRSLFWGTPHDLASLYGLGRTQSDPANVPDGYGTDNPTKGRPVDSVTTRGKQENNFGKDPLGVKRMKDTDKNEGDGRPKLREDSRKSESAQTTFLRNKTMFSKMNKKQLVFEQDQDDSKLLDESQLKG